MTVLSWKHAVRITIFALAMFALLFTQAEGAIALSKTSDSAQLNNYAIVFVSRKIPGKGSFYLAGAGALPGVGPYSRVQVAAPGKLLVREADGSIRALINGANPTEESLNLIDVNSPDVSYDGTKILFAGLVNGSYSKAPSTDPGAWRIYVINVDGSGLQQLTFSDRDIDLSQFRATGELFERYDDFDPAWLPDGRIVFSSTRWPSFGQYGGVRTSNLFVMNADGSDMHRITSERNGADRPQVDPLTGKIVYARWWRNFRVATDSLAQKPDPMGGYIMKDGLLSVIYSKPPPNTNEVGGHRNLDRNIWHLATINPDGTGVAQWAGRSSSYFYGQIANHAYGGGFAPDGTFYANFFPMNNMTEASGFGGIRRYTRGPKGYVPIIGVTDRNDSKIPLVNYSPPSYGIYKSNYAAEPEVLPDGRLLISLAKSTKQDYDLYTINADGTGLKLLYEKTGTTELRARVIRSRPLPPILTDQITQHASPLPPLENGPYDVDGTFTFRALNVYFNAPVDTDMVSAIPVGSANTIRFFIDHQRWQQNGSHEGLDWPIEINEVQISPNGSVTHQSPANVPLFEQIRTATDYKVPLTGKTSQPIEMGGAAHVAGMNFGRPGEVQTCVGCHAGHSMIPIPANPADAQWTNLAPGARVSVSSIDSNLPNARGLIDRRVKMKYPPNKYHKYWISKAGLPATQQWVQLTFPVPISVRTVRLYNIPSADSSIQVQNTTVRLFSDAATTQEVANNSSGALSQNGTDVAFNDVLARVVRIEFTSVNGSAAALGEVEVIARGEEIQLQPSVKPGVATLASPANGALMSSLRPALDWSNASSANYYQLQVATNSKFTTIPLDKTGILTSNFTLQTDLLPGKTYYWRVRAFNNIGEPGKWSAAQTFKTPLATPSLASPASGALLLTDRTSFDWGDVTSATSYVLQASTAANFSTLLLNVTTPTSAYSVTTDLPQNKLIHWRVRAKNSAVTGGWSSVLTFTTGNPPSVPILTSPAANAVVTGYKPLLKWKVSTLASGTAFGHYQLQVDDSSDFGSTLLNTNVPDITTSQFELPTNLMPNRKFYWRVRAFTDQGHYSSWSSVFTFRTAVLPPTLYSPANGGSSGVLRPTLDWSDVGSASGYTIQISTNPNFSGALFNANPVSSSYKPSSNLPKNKTLYWRVRTRATNGPSAWSPVYSFTTP